MTYRALNLKPSSSECYQDQDIREERRSCLHLSQGNEATCRSHTTHQACMQMISPIRTLESGSEAGGREGDPGGRRIVDPSLIVSSSFHCCPPSLLDRVCACAFSLYFRPWSRPRLRMEGYLRGRRAVRGDTHMTSAMVGGRGVPKSR